MMFNELAHIFSDDDNQRRSREVLNRVSGYTLYCQEFITVNFSLFKTSEFVAVHSMCLLIS